MCNVSPGSTVTSTGRLGNGVVLRSMPPAVVNRLARNTAASPSSNRVGGGGEPVWWVTYNAAKCRLPTPICMSTRGTYASYRNTLDRHVLFVYASRCNPLGPSYRSVSPVGSMSILLDRV